MMRTTKERDRCQAQKVADSFERAAKLATGGVLVEANARKVLADLMERVGEEETLRTMSIREFFTGWMDTKDANNPEKTAKRYRTVVNLFLSNLDKRAEKPLTALTSRDVEKFLNARLNNSLAPRTVILDVKILRTALNTARRQGLITTNPAEAVELPKKPRGVERGTFTDAEVKLIVDAADGEWKTLVLLGYFTGARLGDCCRMRWADFDLMANWMTYRQSKTGEEVGQPIHLALLDHLEALAGTDDGAEFIMPGMAAKRPSGRNGLSLQFKRIVEKAGLDVVTVPGAGVRKQSRRTFHALRHSFTSALANAGVAPELRKLLTGHKSEGAHKIYTHHERETLRRAVALVPSLK